MDRQILVRRLGLALVLVVIVLMLADFNNRVLELNRLTTQQELVASQATALFATQQALETQIAYATSIQAVEEWAYEEGRMTQNGDVLVVPLPGSEMLPTPTATPIPQETPLANWEVWWALFFDN